jgi:hypothetical protein
MRRYLLDGLIGAGVSVVIVLVFLAATGFAIGNPSMRVRTVDPTFSSRFWCAVMFMVLGFVYYPLGALVGFVVGGYIGSLTRKKMPANTEVSRDG